MGLIILGVIVLAVIALGAYVTSLYNRLIPVKTSIEKAWSAIDVLLKQWHDEIPKLVDVCKVFTGLDHTVYSQIAKARQNLMYGQGPAAKGQAEGRLQEAIKQLFILAESYPQLKSESSFQQARRRVSELGVQIADRRKLYNGVVHTYNIRITSWPHLMIARVVGMVPKEQFKAV